MNEGERECVCVCAIKRNQFHAVYLFAENSNIKQKNKTFVFRIFICILTSDFFSVKESKRFFSLSFYI